MRAIGWGIIALWILVFIVTVTYQGRVIQQQQQLIRNMVQNPNCIK